LPEMRAVARAVLAQYDDEEATKWRRNTTADAGERRSGRRRRRRPCRRRRPTDLARAHSPLTERCRWADDARPVTPLPNSATSRLARPGKWHLASGAIDVDPAHLDDAARFANREGARPRTSRSATPTPAFMAADGEPPMGWLHNMRVEEDEQGHVLKGDITDSAPTGSPRPSPRPLADRSDGGLGGLHGRGRREVLPRSSNGLALLGVTPPGMASLKSLRDSARRARPAVSASEPLPSSPRSAAPTDPATEAVVHHHQKESVMSLTAKYPRGTGRLPDDASDDEVRCGTH
jgi:hypothetical protein